MFDEEVHREADSKKGRYVLRRDGAEAELTYSITSPELVIADHTAVPERLRGSGAGGRLVARLVADARCEGFNIYPLRPFVSTQRRRHPDRADVFST